MSILIILACIVLLVLMITLLKINPFISFLITSILAGLFLGMMPIDVITSVKTGLGKLLRDLVIVILSGAMLGKLVADSGAAQKITTGLVRLFGEKNITWALMITGFIIGIPLFYNVGFVLVVPLIFSIAYRIKLPIVYVGVPLLASLSVTHGFLPPHPSPTALVKELHADLGQTLLYGFIVAIPAVIIAGPIFARTLKKIDSKPLEIFQPKEVPEDKLPSLGNSIFSALLPVVLLSVVALIKPYISEENSSHPIVQTTPVADAVQTPVEQHITLNDWIAFVSEENMIMLIALFYATWSLGLRMKKSISEVMAIYSDAVKDVAMVLLIIAGAGALKQVMEDTHVSKEIAGLISQGNLNPYLMAWLVAATIRLCIGSASVAGITAASLLAGVVADPTNQVSPSLMVLAAGAGSLLFSHVNDAGFWLFKEYFNLSVKDTIRSWSVMETIVSVVGLGMVMILSTFV